MKKLFKRLIFYGGFFVGTILTVVLMLSLWGMECVPQSFPAWCFLIVTLSLLILFVVWPIQKKGIAVWTYEMKDANPLFAKFIYLYASKRAKRLTQLWLNRTAKCEDIPMVEWEEDKQTSKGINSFYCLDQQSDDTRPLLMSEWNLQHDKTMWWRSQFGEDYLFAPELSPQPIYQLNKTDDHLHIHTGSILDTWIYLVSKQAQGDTYALDFDFTPHTAMQETLQICFCSNSLAYRLRYNLENNKTLKFDIVDRAHFTYWSDVAHWDNFKQPCSLPLHQKSHIRLEVIRDTFVYYINGVRQMAIRLKDFESFGNRWYLIFWNGVDEAGKMEMDIEIENFKIYKPK